MHQHQMMWLARRKKRDGLGFSANNHGLLSVVGQRCSLVIEIKCVYYLFAKVPLR